jgi:copper(I)-binding protein
MLVRPLALALFAIMLSGTAAFSQSVTVGSLSLTDLWTRATPPGAPTAGGYLTITNTGTEADRLLSVASPDAASGELHQMQMSNGIMEMRAVTDGIEIPPGGTVTLAPSGFHMMFVTLKQPLKNGGELPVTLIFAKAGTITTTLHIYPVGSKGPESAANHDATGGMDMGNQ